MTIREKTWRLLFELGAVEGEMPSGVWNLSRVDLNGAELSRTDLTNTDLSDSDLSKANLTFANLSGSNLSRTNLSEADLSDAKLTETNLSNANLYAANLNRANLKQAILCDANLEATDLRLTDFRNANLKRALFKNTFASMAKFNNADLSEAEGGEAFFWGADFSGTNFTNAVFKGANFGLTKLKKANFSGATFSRTTFVKADLGNANLSNSDFDRTDFTESNLYKANLRGTNIIRATMVSTNLEMADISECYIYGISAWNLRINQKTKQLNMVITSADEPTITCDNIEVAQFIYLLLHNEKIRQIINTVANKAVLILGRFTPERKEVLTTIANELRKRDLCPITFDFQKSENQDIIETVKTLASMSKFIIADVTQARVIPDELRSIVPDYAVPVVPIFSPTKLESKPYASLDTLNKYQWVLDLVKYKDSKHLVRILLRKVIKPAELKHLELQALK